MKGKGKGEKKGREKKRRERKKRKRAEKRAEGRRKKKKKKKKTHKEEMEQQQQQQHQPGLLGNLHQHLLHPALSSIQSTFSKLLNPNTINNTTTFTTFFSSFPHDAAAMETPTQTAMTIVLATSLVLLLLLWTTIKKILFPAVVVRPGEPCEPPVLKPRVPFVGHILGLALESNGYYTRLL